MPQFTIRGLAVPALAKIDEVMQAYMTQNKIKARSVAVARKGRLVFARAYTNEEAGYPITQPTSLFRVASCSKVITRAAIYQLMEKTPPKLKTTDNVQAICGFTSTSNGSLPSDPKPSNLNEPGHYFNAVTVLNLLLHQGGWNRDIYTPNDPSYYHDFDIAKAFGHLVPVSKQEYQRWGVSQPMQFYPGSDTHYSNFGFSILGTVIEKKTGLSYIDAVMKNIFGPLGVSRPRLGLPLENERAPGEVKYHPTPNRGPLPNVMDPNQPDVPEQYGAENNRLFDAFGGWITSAADYARFLAAYGIKQSPMPAVAAKDMFVMGESKTKAGTTIINWHGGGLPGAEAFVAYRSDEVSLVVLDNGNGTGLVEYKGVKDQNNTWLLNDLLDEVKADKWPTWDLFPLVEIPAIACDAVSWGANRLDIVARGTDGSLQHTWHDPQKGWGGWESLGLQIASAPQMVNWGESGRLDVFAWGQDHAIWHAWHHPVNGWATESLHGPLASRPHAVSWGKNRLDIFALGLDYAVWHQWHDPVTGWGKWESQGGTFATPPVAISWGTGRLDIFALGLDYALWHLWHDPTKGWGTWENLGNTLTSPPSVVSWGPGRLDVFALGTDRTLQHLWHDPKKGWGAWESLGSTLASAPSAASWFTGRLDIFALGTNRSLMHQWHDPVSGWGKWESLGGSLTSQPKATSWGKGRLDIFARGDDMTLYHHWHDPTKGWGFWESLGGNIG